MTGPASLPPAYFERLYAADRDPWRFASSAYEHAKYDATLAALPCRRFRSAFEVGCSIGVLTRRLASRCTTLLAVDVADVALVQARRRCARHPWVAIRHMHVPQDWPEGRFDLILLSEMLYYLSCADLTRCAALTRASLARGGLVLLVHWTQPTDYPLSGDAASDAFIAAVGLMPTLQRRAGTYRLDLLQG
jgi:predicted TPR repeat methyltransferase